MRSHPRALGFVIAGLSGLVALASCDSLTARHGANEGAALYKVADYQKAAEKYEAAAQLDPNIAEIHLNLGFTYLSLFHDNPKSADRTKYGKRAAEEFKKYMALKPEDPRGRNYLLQVFVDAKAYEEAKAYFEPDLAKTPPSLEAITILGQIAAKLGRLDQALAWNKQRAEIAPKDPDAHQATGVLLWDHLHNHPEVTGDARIAMADQGIAALARAIELRPEAPEAYTYTNLLYRERAPGHVCADPDAGAPDLGFIGRGRKAVPVDSGIEPIDAGADPNCEEDRSADLNKATEFMKTATEKVKARSGPMDAGVAADTGAGK